MDARTASKLIATGLGFGCVHVLTGADHLSALATLSVGSRLKAFSLGIRWGLGHSTGLIVVAGLLLGLDDKIDATKIEHYCNWIVGVFMIGLGVWGVYKALRTRRKRELEEQAAQELATAAAALEDEEGQGQEKKGATEAGTAAAEEGRVGQGQGQGQQQQAGAAGKGARVGTASSSNTSSSEDAWSAAEEDRDEEEMVRLPINSGNGTAAAAPAAAMGALPASQAPAPSASASSAASSASSGAAASPSPSPPPRAAGAAVGGKEPPSPSPQHPYTPTREPLILLQDDCEEATEHALLRCCRWLRLVDIESPFVQRIVAFSIGIVHGIAGPGGILGVLPAVQLHSWEKASLYLFTFCLASTLIMGVFAAMYGELTHRVGLRGQNLDFALEIFSAALSIIVGVLWIALVLAGKLNVVFGG